MSTELNTMFEQIYNLPQVPEVITDLIQQVNSPNIDMAEIAKNVEKEPAIALKILRLVNSAHYGLSRKVNSINEALAFLGMDELKTLIIASGIVNAMPKINDINIKDFWDQNFCVANHAKRLAQETKQNPDLAFTAGLISGVGTLLIHLGDPSAAMEVEQHVHAGHSSRAVFEKRRLGFTSAEVAAELCRRWKFPDELVSAIKESADPLEVDHPSKIACIVYISKTISEFSRDATQDKLLSTFPYDVAEEIYLSKAVVEELLPALMEKESDLSGLAA